MKELKALGILKSRLKELKGARKIVDVQNSQLRLDLPIKNIEEAIKELEEFNNRSCSNCNKYNGNIEKDCKTLAFEFNQQLKINGYLMNESKFYCSDLK